MLTMQQSPSVRRAHRHRARSRLSSSNGSAVQCSAHFLHRLDLNDYTIETLKQVVNTVVSVTQSKGLKVKLSIPDEGLVVENVADSNQSWMYKQSELLYFWPDPFYLKVIVIISQNRPTTTSYSASIFRLRGNQTVQLFLQRAQEYFAQLSTLETIDRRARKTRSRRRTKKSTITPIRLITRTEFDPGQISPPDSIASPQNRRTYSETSDSTTKNPPSLNESKAFSLDSVAELVRELKELRQEIATLKLETRITPVRSTSTSPIPIPIEPSPASVTDDLDTSQRTKSVEMTKDFISNERDREDTNLTSGKDSCDSSLSPVNKKKTTENDNTLSFSSSSSGTVSFRSELENSVDPAEHIYENLPILIQMDSNEPSYYNLPLVRTNDSPYLYVAIADDSSKINQKNRLSLLLASSENSSRPPPTPTVSQVHFANHLTNPLFHVDKQLLANTIANQFGVDLHSPYLEQLIRNQHLFVTHKRTFANMVWQLTGEEMKALCSSPPTTNSIETRMETSSQSATKSILKGPGPFRALTKRRITWNSTVD